KPGPLALPASCRDRVRGRLAARPTVDRCHAPPRLAPRSCLAECSSWLGRPRPALLRPDTRHPRASLPESGLLASRGSPRTRVARRRPRPRDPKRPRRSRRLDRRSCRRTPLYRVPTPATTARTKRAEFASHASEIDRERAVNGPWCTGDERAFRNQGGLRASPAGLRACAAKIRGVVVFTEVILRIEQVGYGQAEFEVSDAQRCRSVEREHRIATLTVRQRADRRSLRPSRAQPAPDVRAAATGAPRTLPYPTGTPRSARMPPIGACRCTRT